VTLLYFTGNAAFSARFVRVFFAKWWGNGGVLQMAAKDKEEGPP
jgi:hypothetical protein